MKMSNISKTNKKHKPITYNRYGYIFLIPFFATYFIFSFIPLISTFFYSFFENYMSGLNQIGPTFIGIENYKTLFTQGDLLKYTGNTILIWVLGFVPQILISLLLASWFTDIRLRLRVQGFFKTVIYMPNIIMASAFAMLFFTLFSDNGPVNNLLISSEILEEPFRFLSNVSGTRGLIALMNFLMWFGNTTILLMAGMMGIDPGLFEAAQVDGASPGKVFRHITLPLLKPILIYVFITSMIGGIQMFDVPEILTNGNGSPNRTSMTLIMYLNKHLFSKNYGMAGALSVLLFIISVILSLLVYKMFVKKED